MGHWYTVLGEMRYDAGLRDARRDHLLPSITTIDKVIANPGLDVYKQRQVLMSSLTMIRGENESDDDFIRRVMDDSRQHARKASQLGSVVHKLIERYIMGKPLFFHGQREDVWKIFKPVRDWIDANIMLLDYGFMTNYGAEVVLVNHLGYAGKADYYGKLKNGRNVIIDWKTTFIKPGDIKKDGDLRKSKYYSSWTRQLAALKECNDSIDTVMNVVISTNPETLGVWVKEWSEEETSKAFKVFLSAFYIWQDLNNYEVNG